MRIDDLTAGPATPLVLAVLTEGESYGYAILGRVRELADGEFGWDDALVYPLFRRLHRLGYVKAECRPLSGGRRRTYYSITNGGRAALARRPRRRTAGRRALRDAWRRWTERLLAVQGEQGRWPVRHRWAPEAMAW